MSTISRTSSRSTPTLNRFGETSPDLTRFKTSTSGQALPSRFAALSSNLAVPYPQVIVSFICSLKARPHTPLSKQNERSSGSFKNPCPPLPHLTQRNLVMGNGKWSRHNDGTGNHGNRYDKRIETKRNGEW